MQEEPVSRGGALQAGSHPHHKKPREMKSARACCLLQDGDGGRQKELGLGTPTPLPIISDPSLSFIHIPFCHHVVTVPVEMSLIQPSLPASPLDCSLSLPWPGHSNSFQGVSGIHYLPFLSTL